MILLKNHLTNYFKNKFYIIYIFLFISCENTSFTSEKILESYEYSIISSNDINISTYQTYPSIGKSEKISIGNNEFFNEIKTFIEFNNYHQNLKSVLKIDSGFIKLNFFDTQNIDSLKLMNISLGIIEKPEEYNEVETNYNNISWLDDDYLKINPIMEIDSVGLYHLVFNFDSNYVKILNDSTLQPLFILEESNVSNEILTFYSSNSLSNKPFIKIFASTISDTSNDSTFIIDAISDVTIFDYPKLNEEFKDTLFHYSSIGAGLKTIIKPMFENIMLSSSVSIIKAYLDIGIDTSKSFISSESEITFQAFALEDSSINWEWGEIKSDDNYNIISNNFSQSLISSIENSKLSLDITDYVQSIISKRPINGNELINNGLKIEIINSKSLFDIIVFKNDSTLINNGFIKIFYEKN